MNQLQNNDQSKGEILVVDDNINNLNLLSDILNVEGYKVRRAINGQMALMRVKKSPIDLILLDINMPEINGYELCEQLKSNPESRNIPVIFLSALNDTLDKVKAFSVGGVDYITKPFQVEEILVRVKNHLTIQHLQTSLNEQNTQLQHLVLREKEKTQQLEMIMRELTKTQSQLIQFEKMSALGKLVAGIAHEINNPITFIHGNIQYLETHLAEIFPLIKLYQQFFADIPPKIQQYQSSLDLEFITQDLPKIINSMNIGTQRVNTVVQGLRNFARLDESSIKSVDIHEGIENTLMFLQHQLTAGASFPEIKLVKNYAQLPNIYCYVSELNQVFMNILNNAIAALRKVENHPEPIITIKTAYRENGMVLISIADNGVGMEEEVRSRIFDPFFTTQPVGAGTGLGLSICYSIIVETHRGKLTCISSPQQGTEFAIEIPSDLVDS